MSVNAALQELLPGILTQLGSDNLAALKKLAEMYAKKGAEGGKVRWQFLKWRHVLHDLCSEGFSRVGLGPATECGVTLFPVIRIIRLPGGNGAEYVLLAS